MNGFMIFASTTFLSRHNEPNDLNENVYVLQWVQRTYFETWVTLMTQLKIVKKSCRLSQ